MIKPVIQTQQNWQKPHFGLDLDPLGSNSGALVSFLKIWLCQSLVKTNDSVLRKFSE